MGCVRVQNVNQSENNRASVNGILSDAMLFIYQRHDSFRGRILYVEEWAVRRGRYRCPTIYYLPRKVLEMRVYIAFLFPSP